ncbi:MAG: hypothetical protein K9N23_01045 [Akkermansiaceae bacterium]|nr:hypothetical protein [Akkermansiaceae bacterium]
MYLIKAQSLPRGANFHSIGGRRVGPYPNREGCGKDTCADLTHLAYTGRSIICAPLSKECDDEMRKRITSALLAGSRFFHLANMKGHVRYASLEAATDDSGVWEDRRLG